MSHEVMTISNVHFYSRTACTVDQTRCLRKEAFHVRITYSQNVMWSQIYVIFSIGNIGLICLKIFLIAVWIPVWIAMKYLRI